MKICLFCWFTYEYSDSCLQEWVANFEKPKGDPSSFIKPATTVLSPYLKVSHTCYFDFFIFWSLLIIFSFSKLLEVWLSFFQVLLPVYTRGSEKCQKAYISSSFPSWTGLFIIYGTTNIMHFHLTNYLNSVVVMARFLLHSCFWYSEFWSDEGQ